MPCCNSENPENRGQQPIPQRKDLQEFILPSSPKHHISAGLSPKEQQLSYREQVLQDSHTLEHYGIKRVGAPSLE